MMTATILPGCPSAPEGLVCGLPRRERLRMTLEKKGFQILTEDGPADLKIPDCHVLVDGVDGEDLHLCQEGLPKVENRLLKSLKKPMEEDGVICHFLHRRISLALTRRLMNTRVTPTQVTLATMMIGLSSGAVIALGGYWPAVIGTLLLELQSILDCVDGELARLRFQGSLRGEWLDTLSDDLAELSFLTGATLATSIPWLRVLGWSAIGATLIRKGILYYFLKTVYHTGDLTAFRWGIARSGSFTSRLRFLVKQDFFSFSSLLLALLGLINVALGIAAVESLVILGPLLWQVSKTKDR